jgi:hypothetical protein
VDVEPVGLGRHVLARRSHDMIDRTLWLLCVLVLVVLGFRPVGWRT